MTFTERVLCPHEILTLDEEMIYYVDEGVLQLWELHHDGTEILVNLLKEGDAWKRNTALDYVYELRSTSEPTTVYEYNWQSVHNVEEKYFLLRKIQETYMRAESFNIIKRIKFVKDRLQSLLQLLVQEFGEYAHNGYKISLTLTHEQLASLILSTRTTVTKLLNELKKEQVVTFEYQTMHIHLSHVIASPTQEVVFA